MMSDIELFDVINKLTVCMPLDELTWGALHLVICMCGGNFETMNRTQDFKKVTLLALHIHYPQIMSPSAIWV